MVRIRFPPAVSLGTRAGPHGGGGGTTRKQGRLLDRALRGAPSLKPGVSKPFRIEQSQPTRQQLGVEAVGFKDTSPNARGTESLRTLRGRNSRPHKKTSSVPVPLLSKVSRLLPTRDAGPISWMGSSTGRLARGRWSAAGPLSTAVSFSAGPMVRIRFPPAGSQQRTWTLAAAEAQRLAREGSDDPAVTP